MSATETAALKSQDNEVSELAELLLLLQKEESQEDERRESTVEVDAVKARLSAEFESVGQPIVKRLRELAASENVRAALEARKLNFDALRSRGISSDLVDQTWTSLRELFSYLNGTMSSLERIPRRIAALAPDDIRAGAYQEPSVSDQISADIRSAPANLAEVEGRVASVPGLLKRLVNSPRHGVTMFKPERPGDVPSRNHNPVAQVTTEG